MNIKMKVGLLLIACSLFAGYATAQLADMEVAGTLKIGSDTVAEPAEGTIRYNSQTADFEGFNGEYWVSFTSGNKFRTVKDTSGNVYRTVIIGGREWMAENLRTTKYSNGDDILNITNSTDWSMLSNGAWVSYIDNDSFDIPHGKLYNWFAVEDGRGVCPEGWSVPSDADFDLLVESAGGSAQAGANLKEVGTNHWSAANTGATNSTGFTAVSNGFRSPDGSFPSFAGTFAILWKDQEATATHACPFTLSANDDSVNDSLCEDKKHGFAIRCVKD